MLQEIKFELGNDVFFMYENKATIAEVQSVGVHIGKTEKYPYQKETVISYAVRLRDFDKTILSVNEKQCFPTKEALLASL
jgi:hypothetical protein